MVTSTSTPGSIEKDVICLNDLSRALQINDTLMNAHLVSVPSLGTFTTGSLAGGDSQNLRWHADWALNTEVLFFSGSNKLRAHFLERWNVAGGQCDADLVVDHSLLSWFADIFKRHLGFLQQICLVEMTVDVLPGQMLNQVPMYSALIQM